jgi:hypothetical protein
LASPPPSPVSKLSRFLSLPVCRRSSILTGEGGGGREEAESFDGKKACSSMDNSILFGYTDYTLRNRCVFLKVDRDEMKTFKFFYRFIGIGR